MLSDHAGQASDDVGIDADQASGAANATALVEVLEHGKGCFLGEMAVEQGRAFAFGEAVLAGLTVEQPDVVLLAVAGADREVTVVTGAVQCAHRVLTTEACEVVHAGDRSGPRRFDEVRRDEPDVAHILRCSPVQCSVFSNPQARPNVSKSRMSPSIHPVERAGHLDQEILPPPASR
jgi:hypothetical protein